MAHGDRDTTTPLLPDSVVGPSAGITRSSALSSYSNLEPSRYAVLEESSMMEPSLPFGYTIHHETPQRSFRHLDFQSHSQVAKQEPALFDPRPAQPYGSISATQIHGRSRSRTPDRRPLLSFDVTAKQRRTQRPMSSRKRPRTPPPTSNPFFQAQPRRYGVSPSVSTAEPLSMVREPQFPQHPSVEIHHSAFYSSTSSLRSLRVPGSWPAGDLGLSSMEAVRETMPPPRRQEIPSKETPLQSTDDRLSTSDRLYKEFQLSRDINSRRNNDRHKGSLCCGEGEQDHEARMGMMSEWAQEFRECLPDEPPWKVK